MNKQWQNLKCDQCNSSEDFIVVVALKWQDGLGLTTQPKGYTCQRCKKSVVVEKMIRAVKERSLQQQIDELQAQKKAEMPTPPPVRDIAPEMKEEKLAATK